MKTIAFISGKGGTGKTSLMASFARLAAPTVVADCDVDAANLALLLPGEVLHSERYLGGQQARIDPDRCTGCGLCAEACRFHAIRETDAIAFEVDPLACEGCGVCHLTCEFDAVSWVDDDAGAVQICRSDVGPLIRAEMRPAASNSGKLVARVRELAKEQATETKTLYVLLDGPPGVGCPVHATLTGVDLAVVITEPTPSGKHDLDRALDLLKTFKIEARVVINKADLSPEKAAEIRALAETWGSPVIAEIPFLPAIPYALATHKAPIDLPEVRPRLELIWTEIQAALEAPVAAEQA